MTWIGDEDWRRRLALREPCEYPENPITDPLGPHWVPTYEPALAMPRNAYRLARSVFGKALSEWALLLADDVMTVIPEAATDPEAPEWTAAILSCVARKMEMDQDALMWEHIQGDIYDMTNVLPAIAERRWQQLKRLGLTVPKDEPPWFQDDHPTEPAVPVDDPA